jgi:hypothetical protein
MKGYKFYAEMPPKRAGKHATRHRSAFTRESLRELAASGGRCSVIAVQIPKVWSTAGHLEGFGGDSGQGNDPVAGLLTSQGYLQKRCVNVDEATARRLHPRLFGYLESPTP